MFKGYMTNTILQEVTDSIKSSTKLYHISDTDMDGKILTPKIPDNFMTKNGFEDSKTPRVSFAMTIDGAVMGITRRYEHKQMYVHIAVGEYTSKRISNKDVPDASITKEIWVTSTVKLKCIGKIELISDVKNENGLPYKYGTNTAELFRWEWKWINKQE